jgi:hypothetical protein
VRQADLPSAWPLPTGSVEQLSAGRMSRLRRCSITPSITAWGRRPTAHSPAGISACWYAVSGNGRWGGDRKQTPLWQVPAWAGRRDDPQHPEAGCLRAPPDGKQSRPGEAIYKPFCDSGTTIIADEMTGRSVHAIEMSPAYIDVAVRRWEAFTGQQYGHWTVNLEASAASPRRVMRLWIA